MCTRNPVGYFTNGVFYCLLFLSVLVPPAVKAEAVQPFTTRDQNPLVLIYGLPTPVSAKLLATNESRLTTSLNLSNTINGESPGSEYLFVDAETYQLNIFYDYGIAENWMLRLQLPLIRHSGGFMDTWIDRYHNLLGLPEHIRPAYPNDQIHIDYMNAGQSLLAIDSSESGLGDISIQLAYQAMAEKTTELSYWLSLKLPSGDASQLTGSDATDLALWLALNKSFASDYWFYLNAGGLIMGDSKVLSDQHNDFASFTSLGIQFPEWHRLLFKLQLEGHSAFYDSNTRFLSEVVQLSFGATIQFQHSSLDMAVAEDLRTLSSPDVNFNITWRQYF